MRQKNNYIRFRNAAIAAASVGLIAFGFQNCGNNGGGQNGGGSNQKPVVAKLCEEAATDAATCLTRSWCTHNSERNCNTAADFTSSLAFDRVDPLIVHATPGTSLWTSINKESVTYQWYKSNSFYILNETGRLNEKTQQNYKLPDCSDTVENPETGLGKNSISYFYAKASYGSKNLKAPFLVACSEAMQQATGNSFKGLSADDEFSHDGITRQVCDQETCTTSDYKRAGDLILLRNGDTMQLQMDTDEADVSYKWYYSTNPNISDFSAVSISCDDASNGVTCVVQSSGEATATDTLPIEFNSADTNASACALNKVVYFHALATKDNYKKQAIFRVACVEAQGGSSTAAASTNEAEDEEGDAQTQASASGGGGSGSTATTTTATTATTNNPILLWPDSANTGKGEAGEGVNQERITKEIERRVGEAINVPPFPEASGDGATGLTYRLTCVPRNLLTTGGLSFDETTRVLSGNMPDVNLITCSYRIVGTERARTTIVLHIDKE